MNKKIRKVIIIFVLVVQSFLISTTHAWILDNLWWSVKNSFVNSEQDIHGRMLVWDQQSSLFWGNWDWWASIKLWASTSWVSIKDNFIKNIIRYLLWIVAIVSITVFIYLWYELFSAEWKQEVLKKSFKALVYAAVWLAVIPLAFILVKITTWFSF